MKHFVIVLAILVIIPISIAGCGGDNMDYLWVDTQGDGYPDLNDDKFVPVFIKENKKSLDNLAKMMLSYDFRFFCDYHDDEVRVIIYEEDLSKKEEDILREEIKKNEKLMLYLSALLKFEYIYSVQTFITYEGYRSLSVGFITQSTPSGSLARSAGYCSYKEIFDITVSYSGYHKHVAGNWYYFAHELI